MRIILNGEPEEVTGDSSVASLLRDLGMNPEIVAVTVNDQTCAREKQEGYFLRDGDKVEILLFMGGGQ